MQTVATKVVMVVLLAVGLTVNADLTAVSPCADVEVVLLPKAQKDVMALPTYDERLAAMRANPESKWEPIDKRTSKIWRVPLPLKLTWSTNGDERGPWLVKLGKSEDLHDAVEYYMDEVPSRGANRAKLWTLELPRANLEIGQTYYWQVFSNVKCKVWPGESMLTNEDACRCIPTCKVRKSAICKFHTEAMAPRWIILEGRTRNVRDLGGRIGAMGRRVRQGMVFRGEGLNDNSVNGDKEGENRLTVTDVKYLTQTLGIKTDLDLRTERETSKMKESPLAVLGAKIQWVPRSSLAYKDIFTPEGMKIMAENFRLFVNRANYPIFFHCIGGADRTGSLAYVLNGVLGVSQHELETDYEETFYPKLPEFYPDYKGVDTWRREGHFTEGIKRYGAPEANWMERCEAYLLACGITAGEIETFRGIMLEPLP